MLTCYLQYKLDLTKIDEFQHYAKTWQQLIEDYGGIYHGYFLPDNKMNEQYNCSFSFPDIAKATDKDIAIALFSFKDEAAYQAYKRDVAEDPRCMEITEFYQQTQCFLSYQRSFVVAI